MVFARLDTNRDTTVSLREYMALPANGDDSAALGLHSAAERMGTLASSSRRATGTLSPLLLCPLTLSKRFYGWCDR